MTSISYRTCPLCEATCGLELHMEGRDIKLVRGDRDDVFSKGYLCPKGTAIKELESDPDRLRVPQIRDRATDTWRDATWDEAFAYIDERLTPLLDQHGRDALAVYLGNPGAHNLAPMIYNRVLNQAAGTRNVFSASTVDQMPKQVSSGLMFGGALTVPVADIDRTDYLLILGANPFASNGSLMTCPDFPGRLRALQARGGRYVVVDPRRSKTAEESDEWIAIVPGTDAHLLFAIVHVLFRDDLITIGDHIEGFVDTADVARVRALAGNFSPEAVAATCGVDAATIERLAHELAAAPTAAVYARIGTCTQEFGTVASWLVDVVNILTGNLDRAGGAMFNLPATGANAGGSGGKGRGVRFGRRQSRVRGLPEFFGELPVVCLAEEIETPGEGQIRALVTVAGNPVVSNPDAQRLDRAFATLDFMVSIDIYCNETTRHADVILPPEPLLARGHYDLALRSLAVRNVATYSAPVYDVEPGVQREWETLCRLAGLLQGLGHNVELITTVDEFVVNGLVQKAAPRLGMEPEELMASISANGRCGPERIVDLMLRSGPYQLSLDELIANPHGIDLGPLQPRVPDVLRTPSGGIDLAPDAIVADVEERLVPSLSRDRDGLVLVGRRDLRSNNSWMHNLRVLVKGKPRCTLHVNPHDAARLGLADGAAARVASKTGEVELAVEITDSIRTGVVSIPHGWGHDSDGVRLSIAREHAGVNSNILASTDDCDPLSGNAILNGIPVEVVAV